MRNPQYLFRYLTEKFKLNHFHELSSLIEELYKSNSKPVKVLDLGAGNANYWFEGPLSRLMSEGQIQLTIVDVNEELLQTNSSEKVKYVIGQVPQILGTFKNDEFDCICAFDLIEHLSKVDGYGLLYEMDRIAKRFSMLYTPNGFVWQPGSSNNSFNSHISEWKPKELRKLSWNRQRGFVGIKIFFGPYSLRKYQGNSHAILEIIAIFQLITYFIPKFAFSFSAVKVGKNARIEKQS